MSDTYSKEDVSALIDGLKDVNHRFLAVYDKVSEEREETEKERIEMGKLLARFTEQVDKFNKSEGLSKNIKDLDESVRKLATLERRTFQTVAQNLSEISKGVKAVTLEAASEAIKDPLERLNEASRKAQASAQTYHQARTWLMVQGALITLGTSLILTLLFLYMITGGWPWEMRFSSLSSTELYYMYRGQAFERVLGRLPPKEAQPLKIVVEEEVKKVARGD